MKTVPAYSTITAGGRAPERWVLYLHGVLGSRSNLRSVARRFVEARPSWGALLADLREHGDSRGFAPPHTVEAAARDLATLDGQIEGAIRAVVGHSFGGKVALAWARDRAVDHVWLVDSMPGARPSPRGDAITVLELLEGLAFPMATRETFVDAVVGAGLPEAVARWLAMNLERREDGRHDLAVDTVAIRELLVDYFALDLWPTLAELRPTAHLVLGGASNVFTPDDVARAEALHAEGRLRLHRIERAGHFVHLDAPDALHEVLVSTAHE